MKRITLINNIEDLKSFILGTTILATGGGGLPEPVYELLEKIYEKVSFVKLSELSGEHTVVSPYLIGSMSSLEVVSPREILEMVKKAVSMMEARLSKRINAVVSAEIGGGNTLIALLVAALLEVPVVDGDLVGRAAPEIHQSTAHIFNKPVTPSVIVTKTGSSILIDRIGSIDDYENLARYVAYLSRGSAFVIDTPLNGEEAKQVVIEGTLSLSLQLGKQLREIKEKGKDPIPTILKMLNGYKIFQGTISSIRLQNTGKFLEGNVFVENKGLRLNIYIKNEYLYASIKNRPIVMPPDLIVLFDSNYNPILTNRIKKNEFVYVVACEAPKIWRTPKGLELFGPKRFGINHDYIPVENLIRTWNMAEL